MKKIISLVLFLLIAQTSWANEWFPQIPSTEQPAPNTETMPKTLPPGQNKSLGLFLKAPCGHITEMTNTIKKYREEMLFHGTGLTFSPQNQVYNGGMFFFTNQETGSWTIMQVFSDGMACMIMNGKNFKPYIGDQPYGEQR